MGTKPSQRRGIQLPIFIAPLLLTYHSPRNSDIEFVGVSRQPREPLRGTSLVEHKRDLRSYQMSGQGWQPAIARLQGSENIF